MISAKMTEHSPHDTTKIKTQILNAEESVSKLRSHEASDVGLLSKKDRIEHLAVIELALRVFEHKFLRVQELEQELKNQTIKNADLTIQLDRAKRTLALLEALSPVEKTGT